MCANTNDKFTLEKSNGNGALIYPIGLLTADEMMYAGATGLLNSSFYLYTGQTFWTLSPSDFKNWSASGFYLTSPGSLNDLKVDDYYGLRPSVSLKRGTTISGGSGTATDPFIIK